MKIVTIGAGSLAWGPIVNIDFLTNAELDGAELMLMDINEESLALVKQLLDRLVEERGFRKTVSATTDLTSALRDADYVLSAISVGGDHLWRYDSMFPQIYDIFQPVGDTIGPGGLMRALRHAGPLLNIGRTMCEVSRPGAPLIQLTNPMNPLCGALEQIDGLTVYGICHGVNDTEKIIADQLGIATDQVRVEAAGNNHFIFCDRITIGDKVYTQNEFGELIPRLFDTPFREEAYRRYGGYVGNYSRHPIEFVPNFLSPESQFGRTWGVPPLAEQIDPMFGSRHDRARELLDRALAQSEPISWANSAHGGLSQNAVGALQVGHSREGIDAFILALEHGNEYFTHVNVANQDAIAGVAPEYNVELPVTFKNGVMNRHHIQFNDAITAEIERIGKEQYLLSQACLHFDEEVLVESLSLDALVPNRDVAARLVREMTAYQRDYLPNVAV